mgnify:CR=1 FL=1
MSSKYSPQKRKNARQNQRKNTIIVIAVAVIMVIFVLIGLAKVVSGGEEGGTNKNVNISATPNPQNEQTTGTPTPEPTITQEATPTPTNTPTPTPTPGPIIAIDPGHGGEDDWGTTKGVHREKNINLAIALFLRDILEERGYRTYMIREDDSAVENKTRSGLAKENGASLYVSIHQNSLEEENDAGRGAEVWYCDLFDTRDAELAQCVLDELTAFVGMKSRGIKLSNKLIVLKENTLPACLVECGFMSSPTERELLLTEDYQKKIAEGIANGIQKFMPLETE